MLLNRLNYEARREKGVGNYGGECGNVHVRGTNESYAANTMRSQMMDQRIDSVAYVKELK